MSGIVLGFATILALVASNSSLAGLYNLFLDLPAEIHVGRFGIAKPLLLRINDGWVAIFFLFVGLEVKRDYHEADHRYVGDTADHAVPLRLGILGGPLLAGVVGYLVLRASTWLSSAN